MKEFKGTKGEWIIERNTESRVIFKNPDIDIWYGKEFGGTTIKEAKSNAKLISAAPELLEACIEFVRKCDNGQARSVKSYAQMKSAINKALGL